MEIEKERRRDKRIECKSQIDKYKSHSILTHKTGGLLLESSRGKVVTIVFLRTIHFHNRSYKLSTHDPKVPYVHKNHNQRYFGIVNVI